MTALRRDTGIVKVEDCDDVRPGVGVGGRAGPQSVPGIDGEGGDVRQSGGQHRGRGPGGTAKAHADVDEAIGGRPDSPSRSGWSWRWPSRLCRRSRRRRMRRAPRARGTRRRAGDAAWEGRPTTREAGRRPGRSGRRCRRGGLAARAARAAGTVGRTAHVRAVHRAVGRSRPWPDGGVVLGAVVLGADDGSGLAAETAATPPATSRSPARPAVMTMRRRLGPMETGAEVPAGAGSAAGAVAGIGSRGGVVHSIRSPCGCGVGCMRPQWDALGRA